MPSLTSSQLKGNLAEAVAAAVLSRRCLVRQVASGTDVGVDLFCESTEPDPAVPAGGLHQPHVHFWVQVKGVGDAAHGADPVSHSFDTDNLRYWERQPVPVLAFLVPLPKHPFGPVDVVHVVDITSEVLRNGVKAQKAQTLRANPDLVIPLVDPAGFEAAMNRLIDGHIPMLVSALFAAQGFIRPAPKLRREATQFFSAALLNATAVEDGIRRAAAFLVIHQGGAVSERVAATVQAFKDDLHYETATALGILAQRAGDAVGAVGQYRRAINMVSEWMTKESDGDWSEVLRFLEQRLREAGLGGTIPMPVGAQGVTGVMGPPFGKDSR